MRRSSFVSLLILAMVLSACSAGDRLPKSADGSIALLKNACNAACESTVATDIFLPADSFLYSTKDAICIRSSLSKNAQLFCGTCGCDTFGLEEKALARSVGDKLLTCTFTGNGEQMRVSCQDTVQ